MAYGTPRYDYGQASATLSNQKQSQDAAQAFGTFLGQQRYRRNLQDANQAFTRNIPKVGASFNRRGLYNSGLRREGQNQFVSDYGRTTQRLGEDQVSEATQGQLQQTARDAQYQQALQLLFEQYQAQRAQLDPFASIQGVL